MKKYLLLSIFALFFVATSLSAQELNYDNIAPHPRLLLKSGDITAMKEFASRSDNARKTHDMIITEADGYLSAMPLTRKMTGRRLLSVSREALKRVFYLSYAYLMTDDVRYAQRAEREMLTICEFDDWNPAHFLDVGEMTMALAIGYDWLYRYLPVHSRSIIGTAIYEKGLLASENDKQAWFFTADNNWNQVCNAGMIYGALATLERSPEYCKALIAKCIESNPIAQKCYEPDGGYPEGYSYWDYGTSFEVMLVAALQSALGTDAGIASQKSFMNSASFMTYLTAPSGKSFNFADSGAAVKSMPAKYWFARQSNDASIVAVDEMLIKQGKLEKDRLLPIYMLFGSSLDLGKTHLPKSHIWVNHGEAPIFVYRSGWESDDDTYFAIKGGQASTNHAHMDAGSFIYERDGVRWAIDLGMHDYNTLEQAGVDLWNRGQNSERWSIFRLGAESHNVLTINNQPHNVKGIAEIVETFDLPRQKGAIVNLTPTFEGSATNVTRKAELDKNDNLTITDHIAMGDTPSTVEWRMATNAEAQIIAPNIILLTQDGKTMYLRLKGKVAAEAKIWPDHQYKEFEKVDKNLRRVGFVLQLKAGQTVDVEVSLTSEKGKSISLPKMPKLPKLNFGFRKKA
ncbi:MAG: heparinase II/III family protein [Alistipes sp.]|nr:heparinase II/III family protein [Alistipes sp.]